MTHSPDNQPPNPSNTTKSLKDSSADRRHQENSYNSQSSILISKKMNITWYVRLNIMVISFLFVLFLIKQVQNPAFQRGLSHIFANPSSPPAPPSNNNRSAKIKSP